MRRLSLLLVAAARRPAIVEDHIPYGARRKTQMARYSGRHYGCAGGSSGARA